jgi:predicted  nucleic acid-binding Zn-ribbon protein
MVKTLQQMLEQKNE